MVMGTVARLGGMPRWLLADADRWRFGSAGRSYRPLRTPPIYEHSRPRRVGDEMQQRLVLGRDPGRRRCGCDRLDALALARQQQAQAIITQRRRPIGMPDRRGGRRDKGAKPSLPILAHAPFPSVALLEGISGISDVHPRACEFLTQ